MLTSLDGIKQLFNHQCISKVETDSEGTSIYVDGARYTVKESKEWIEKQIESLTPIVRPMTDKEIKTKLVATTKKNRVSKDPVIQDITHKCRKAAKRGEYHHTMKVGRKLMALLRRELESLGLRISQLDWPSDKVTFYWGDE